MGLHYDISRRSSPHLYEVNCRVWLRRLKERYESEFSLEDVPIQEWRRLKELGFDYIWLMGVWTPSRRGIDIARSLPTLQVEYSKALPGWTIYDVIGSPYAIISYELNPILGASEDLKTVREVLHKVGLGLVLDFVPNHVAVDHPWVVSHPEYFVQATERDARKKSEVFFEVKSNGNNYFLAHGKDPYFPSWLDTAQLNIFNTNVQKSLIEILMKVAEMCDGLRCDMAMLVLNDIFQSNWGWHVERAGFTRPAVEFWESAIETVKSEYPEFLFIAEVYWGLDRKLMQLGFDYTYDKDLYDLLLQGDVKNIRSKLRIDSNYQKRCARFIENHDEQRAAEAFGRERSKAAAAIISTLMGLRLFHDGQIEGYTIKVPIQLARTQPETVDLVIVEYYERLLHFSNHPVLHEGEWTLLDTRSVSPNDTSYENILAWMWRMGDLAKIIIVNYSSTIAQGSILLSLDLPSYRFVLLDEFTGKNYRIDRDNISNKGLYVKLEPYQTRLYTLTGT